MVIITTTLSPTNSPQLPNSSSSDLDYTWTPSPGSHCCYATNCTTPDYHFKPVPGRIYARCKRCCSEFCDECVRKGMMEHDCEENQEEEEGEGYEDCSLDDYKRIQEGGDCKTQ